MEVLITLNTASQVLQVKPYRIIHLCEEGCVVPAEDSQGTVRRFSKDNLFQLAVCLELQNAGVTSARTKKAVRIFNWLARAKNFAPTFKTHGLCGVIEILTEPKSPVMLHVKAPERGVHSAELVMSFLQAAFTLSKPAESGLGTCRDTRGVDIWPVRVTLNLTFILSTIRLR
jgi:DNA-binding transcriptional MerR regulator